MNNILYGLVFGQACGDAVGRYTEFMCENSVRQRYKLRNDFIFPPLPENCTQRQVQECHWTDDTDQMILLMDMLTETKNKCDIFSFAKKLKNWVENGVPELGYTRGIGVGNLTAAVASNEKFLPDPLSASRIAWGGCLASNGSLMRTSILAYRNLNYEDTLRDALLLSKTTHYDPKCSISVLVIVSILWDIINKTPDDLILDKAKKFCSSFEGNFTLPSGQKISYKDEALKYFDILKLDDMDLNKQIGYVFKCMACGLYAFRNRSKPFKEIILDIILKGGDADTNAAVAGAILGAYQGYDNLPKEWVEELPHKEYLIEKIKKYEIVLN